MAKTVKARDANQRFSKLLRRAEAGEEFVITRNGEPVARLTGIFPTGERKLTPEQEAALTRSTKRLRKGWPLGGERVDRDKLHDR